MRNSTKKLSLVLLTLVAFSVQLAVVVLHHHPAKGSGIAARAMTAGMCLPSKSNPCTPSPAHQDNDGCLLCWAQAVAATSVAPELPELPPPQTTVALRLPSFDRVALRHMHRDQFQARGPPAITVA